MSDLYVATLKSGGVFEAYSLLELKRRIADWFYLNDRMAVVSIEGVDILGDDDSVSPLAPITVIGIESEVERMIGTLMANRDSWSGVGNSQAPVRL